MFCPQMNSGSSRATGRSWSHGAERHRGEWVPLLPRFSVSGFSHSPGLRRSDSLPGIWVNNPGAYFSELG